MRNLPSIVSKLPNDLKQFLERVREKIDQGGFVTRDDLISGGIARPGRGGGLQPADGSPIVPPAPINVTATGAMTSIFVEFDYPQYRGHAYAEIWRAETNNLGQAQMVGQTPGKFYADAVGGANVRWYWVRLVSVTDTAGPYNGTEGTRGETAPDPAYLLEQLAGGITESQLYADLNSRIDLIDTSGPADFPSGIIDRIRDQATEFSQLDTSTRDLATNLLDAVVELNTTRGHMVDAGLTVDPSTGEAYIYGVREAADRLDSVGIRLDAAESNISLKASTAYVNQAIAEAVIDPSQVAELGDIYARLSAAEIDIDGAHAAILSKASVAEVSSQGVRLTTAENNIDALEAEIILKVSNSEFAPLQDRVTVAETQISAIDGASITQTVSDLRYLAKSSEADAYTLLTDVINGKRVEDRLVGDIAFARQDLTAKVEEGIAAEASARLQLAALVANNAAAITTEATARATADNALAQQVSTLATTVNNNYATLTTDYYTKSQADGAISSASTALTSAYQLADTATLTAAQNYTGNYAYAKNDTYTKSQADSAISSATNTLWTTVNGHTTSIQTNAQTINGLSAQHTVKIDNNGYVTGYGLASTPVNGTPVSEFAVVADKFSIAPVATSHSANDGSPFFHLTTPTTIGGVSIPAGTYMKAAYIHDATITNAKIANLAAEKITAGDIAVDRMKTNIFAAANASVDYLNAERIDADSFVAKLAAIETAYIDEANITNGAITNAKIGEFIQSNNYAANSAGWRIKKSGFAEFQNVKVRGDVQATSLNAATGTFTGELSAATGTFAGQLLAGVLDLALAAGESHIYDQPGTYSFTVPEGMNAVRISCVGAGGGGGSGGAMGSQGASGGAGGGGGGAGAVVAGTYLGVLPGAVLSITVGAGGTGAPTSVPINGTNGSGGTAGGASSVAGYLSAGGGQPGLGGMGGRQAEAALGGAGGSQGGRAGQNGAPGDVHGVGGAGGGSGYGTPGAPRVLPGGSGDYGVRGSGGAGGSGGTRAIGYGGAGGKGGDGVVVIEAYNPNSVVLQTTFKDFTANHFNPLCLAVGRGDLVFVGEA